MKDISINIKTIKRHAKRLYKILKADGLASEDFKLTQAQEIFARSLGCNNWFELQEIFKHETPILDLLLVGQEKVVYAITNHLNLNKGSVDKKYWYMLMNAHYIMGANEQLAKIINAFSNKFEEDVHHNELRFNSWDELEKEFYRDPEFFELIENFVPPKKAIQRDYKPLIVVIDKSITVLKSIRLFLSPAFEIVLFETSSQALEYLQGNIPELIICEIDMPSLTDDEDNSGYRFINELENKGIPVIFLSHKILTVPLKEKQRFLEKPFNKISLQEKVEEILLKY